MRGCLSSVLSHSPETIREMGCPRCEWMLRQDARKNAHPNIHSPLQLPQIVRKKQVPQAGERGGTTLTATSSARVPCEEKGRIRITTATVTVIQGRRKISLFLANRSSSLDLRVQTTTVVGVNEDDGFVTDWQLLCLHLISPPSLHVILSIACSCHRSGL